MTDRGMVVRACAGEHDAFAALAADALGRLNAVAGLITGDRDAADDAVQDTLVEAWRGIRGLRDPDRWDGWLYRLLVRACRRQAGRERRIRAQEVPLLAPDGPAVGDTQADVALHDQLERGLRRLAPEQRSVLVLSFYLDLALADIARCLDLPVGTVKSRQHRALAALRGAIEADERLPVLTPEGST